MEVQILREAVTVRRGEGPRSQKTCPNAAKCGVLCKELRIAGELCVLPVRIFLSFLCMISCKRREISLCPKMRKKSLGRRCWC